MKKNSRGFTLPEVLAVITLLILLSLIATPIVGNIVEKTSITTAEKSLESYAQAINMASIQYITDNNGEIPADISVIDDMIPANNKDKINNAEVKIGSKGEVNKIKATIDEYSCIYKTGIGARCGKETPSVSEVSTMVYFNPETGNECFDYDSSQSQNDVKSGCMKWYVIAKNDQKVDLLLDHDVDSYRWYSETLSNQYGPSNTAMGLLFGATDSWAGVQNRTDNYSFGSYTISYSGHKARLITAQEIANIVGVSNWDEKTSTSYFYLDGANGQDILGGKRAKYAYLYDNLSGCINFGCEEDNTNGDSNHQFYWTATAVAGNQTNAWVVHNSGNLNGYDVTTFGGIRPVITINVSIIN